MLALAGCGMVDGRSDSQPRLNAPVLAAPPSVASDTPVKIGEPYHVNGASYTPMDDPAYDETGYASWYGEEREGNATANGERFRMTAITAAHRTLPLPSYVEVTALETGRTILVRVNDRGPFSGNRVIDLSRGAAEQLGISGAGSAGVRVRRVNPTEPEKGLLRSGARAPARMDAPETVLIELRKRLPKEAESAPSAPAPAHIAAAPAPTVKLKTKTAAPIPTAKPLSPLPPVQVRRGVMVQIGAYSSKHSAETVAQRLGGAVIQAGKLWRVRTGPHADVPAARVAIEKASAAGFPGARIVVND